MRIPFPERVSYSGALAFAITIGGIQLLEGTNPYFTGLCMAFILLAALAFNITGGMAFPSGAFIGANVLVTLLIPLCVKAGLGEAADTRLHEPNRTIEVYMCGMIAMSVAGVLARAVRPQKSLLKRLAPITNLRTAYYGVAVLAAVLTPYLLLTGDGIQDGSLRSFLNQLNRFPVLAFLLGTAYTVQRTKGKRSVSVPLMIGIVLFSLTFGLLSFSKEAFLSPLICWVLMMAVLRFELKWVHVIVFCGLAYIITTTMTPYAQMGRHWDTEGRTDVQQAAFLLTHMDEVRQEYGDSNAGENEHSVFYYGTRMGLLDRMDIIGIDSALIDVTDRDGEYGYAPALTTLSYFVPHVLWKDKPRGSWGNVYAHEVEVLSDDDYSTGVSFSPTADAYHEGGIFGVLVVETLVLSIGFVLLDSLVGDVRQNLAGLVLTALIMRLASEGLLYAVISLCAQPMFSVFTAALLCAYVFPILGQMFGGGAGREVTAAVIQESA